MSERRIQLKPNSFVDPCPKCGNTTVFTIHSRQWAEDCCEIWAVCGCGFDPTAENTGHRLEDVWGGCSDENARAALACWNEALADLPAEAPPSFRPE